MLKYIRHSDIGFIIWPIFDHVAHVDMATKVGGPNKIISAGFCTLYGGIVKCWGRSQSLDLESRDDDAKALAEQLDLEEFQNEKSLPSSTQGASP